MEVVSVDVEYGNSMIAPGISRDVVDKWYADSEPLYKTRTGEPVSYEAEIDWNVFQLLGNVAMISGRG